MTVHWKSPSSQKQFHTCERQWYYKRVLRLPEPPSHFLAIGNLYHACFEHAVKTPDVDYEMLVDDLYTEHASAPTWTCPTSEANLKKEIWVNLRRVNSEIWTPLWTADAKLEAEIEFKYLAKVDLFSSRRPIVNMGEITGTEDEPGVLDYKIKFSTYNRRADSDAENDEQLAMYCLLKECRWAGFVEIPRSAKAPINVIGKHFTDGELEWWRGYFDSMAETIETRRDRSNGETVEEIEDRFRLAHPSNRLCDSRWCPYWGHCPGGGR